MRCFVIDTNIWVMSLSSSSPYHIIFQALITRKFEIAISHDILLEYEEVLLRKYGSKTALTFLELLDVLPNVRFIQYYYQWNLIDSDPDDNKYVDVAVASGAEFLVTEDRHFKILQQIPFPSVKCIDVDSFVNLVNNL